MILGSVLEVEFLISGVFTSDLCIVGVGVGVETGSGSLPQPDSNAIIVAKRASSMSFRFMSVYKFCESLGEG